MFIENKAADIIVVCVVYWIRQYWNISHSISVIRLSPSFLYFL